MMNRKERHVALKLAIAEWNEEDHPRGDDGKFGGGGGKMSEEKQAAIQSRGGGFKFSGKVPAGMTKSGAIEREKQLHHQKYFKPSDAMMNKDDKERARLTELAKTKMREMTIDGKVQYDQLPGMVLEHLAKHSTDKSVRNQAQKALDYTASETKRSDERIKKLGFKQSAVRGIEKDDTGDERGSHSPYKEFTGKKNEYPSVGDKIKGRVDGELYTGKIVSVHESYKGGPKTYVAITKTGGEFRIPEASVNHVAKRLS